MENIALIVGYSVLGIFCLAFVYAIALGIVGHLAGTDRIDSDIKSSTDRIRILEIELRSCLAEIDVLKKELTENKTDGNIQL